MRQEVQSKVAPEIKNPRLISGLQAEGGLQLAEKKTKLMRKTS
jgi:hypothetical protein